MTPSIPNHASVYMHVRRIRIHTSPRHQLFMANARKLATPISRGVRQHSDDHTAIPPPPPPSSCVQIIRSSAVFIAACLTSPPPPNGV